MTSKGEIKKAINNVINSYSSLNVKDEILIQPYLEHVQLSGVIFSRDPSNNTPYIKINYDINSKKDRHNYVRYFKRWRNILLS